MNQNLIFLLYLKGCPIDMFISFQNYDILYNLQGVIAV